MKTPQDTMQLRHIVRFRTFDIDSPKVETPALWKTVGVGVRARRRPAYRFSGRG